MKKSLFLLCFSVSTSVLFAQNNVGIGTATPDASAILELNDNSKGVLITRLTTAQRTAIAAPANGLLVFDVTVGCFYYFTTPTGWNSLCQVSGATGPTGANGLNGTNGIDGATGPTGANGINGSNGTNGLNGVIGPTGANGLNGTNGANGIDGVTGPTGANGINGTNGTNGLNGATGPTGANGINGSNGTNGLNGATGPTGANGLNGTNGTNGIDGVTGATGPTGANGLNGPAGINGTNGINGATGAVGATGAQGNTGATGAQGVTGVQGITGTQGIQGVTGAQGNTGAVGATGALGNTGVQGATGVTGAQGNTGAVGATGAQGVTGAQGTTGSAGITGPTGPLGAAGGDLSGTYPNPTVVGLQTVPVSATAPLNNQVLLYNGANWIPSDANGVFWKISGNSATVPATNFLGTTDNVDLVFRTNNTEKARIQAAGNVGIGIAAPVRKLHISGVFNNATLGSGQIRQSSTTTAGGYGGGITNPTFAIQQPNIRLDAFGNAAGFNPVATFPTNSYPRYVGVDANGDLHVMHQRTEYYNVVNTAIRANVASAVFTVQPNMTQAITVPAGQTAEVYCVASCGIANTVVAAGATSVVDIAFFVDGALMPYGGFARITCVNSSLGGNSFSNGAITGSVVLGPGAHTVDFRSRRNGGTAPTVNIGGDGFVDATAGTMNLIVRYR